MPEALWKAYIDYEISRIDEPDDDDDDDDDGDDDDDAAGAAERRAAAAAARPSGAERVRALYERLLERTKHVKVWLSYARFEASREGGPASKAGGGGGIAQARELYKRAYVLLIPTLLAE